MMEIGFHANLFVIFDFVPESELQTGRRLEETINDSLLLADKNVKCTRIRCKDKNEFISKLSELNKNVKDNSVLPYIHIEGHGSPEFLMLLDGTKLGWELIFNQFREINISCKNNLFFSSGACNSAYSMVKATHITMASPVFGMLAPEKVVQAGIVQDGFIAFYRALIETGSLNEAFNVFANKANGKDYALIFSQSLFEKTAYKYLTQHCMGKGRQARLESVVTEAVEQTNIPVNSIRKEFRKQLRGPQALELRKFYNKFMLIDLYPENKKRFIFDAVKFEREVKQGKLKIT